MTSWLTGAPDAPGAGSSSMLSGSLGRTRKGGWRRGGCAGATMQAFGIYGGTMPLKMGRFLPTHVMSCRG